MRVNLVGYTFSLGELLWRYGVEAYHDCINPEWYDVTLIGGLWHLQPENLVKPTVVLAIGSDVYHTNPKIRMDLLMEADLTLIAHDAMRPHIKYLAKRMEVWKVPFDSQHFFQWKPNFQDKGKEPERDTIVYTMGPDHANMNYIIDFIRENPLKEITVLGHGYQDHFMERFENVVSVRRVPYGCMPQFYKTHKEYRLWYNRKDLISIMVCEALYMGLKVYGNDEEITKIPPERFENVAIPRLIKYMESII